MTAPPDPDSRKREDIPLLTGIACFAGDAPLNAPLQVVFVRSQSVGRLALLDLAEAAAMPGVVGVHDARCTAHLGELAVNPVIPMEVPPRFAVFAGPEVQATGQPLAAVLAERLPQAMDAAEAIWPEIEDHDWPQDTRAHQAWQVADAEAAFDAAAHVVTCDIHHPRLAPNPMEPRALAARYDAEDGGLTLWHSTQTPHRSRSELARILGLDPARLRVIATHVGGAFGMKASLYPEEVFVAWAALHHQRDVIWQASRSEDFLAATQGRGLTSSGALAVDAQGRFLGLRARITAPLGPWLPNSALIPAWNAGRILPGGYDVPALDIKTRAVHQPLGPVGIYRGAGRPEANALMERLVDKAARACGLDPVEIRQLNLVPPEAMPARTGTGNTLDSGDYPAALRQLCAQADYDAQRRHRDQRRAQGHLAGLGLAFYLEPSGNGWESARVTLHPDGRASVASGSSSQGHGRETAYARIAAAALGLDPARITVALGCTQSCPEGIGALASRATAIGGSAVLQACREALANRDAGRAAQAEVRYENDGQAWGYGAYLVALEICRDTGMVQITRAVCVDDAGVLITPAQAKGQILGGFAQGLGEALFERVVYDDDGQLLTGTLMDYALPRASDLPPLQIHTRQTPSPMNLLGAKGLGEAGTIGAPAAVLNAAVDALVPLGVSDLQMPLRPATLWRAMQGI